MSDLPPPPPPSSGPPPPPPPPTPPTPPPPPAGGGGFVPPPPPAGYTPGGGGMAYAVPAAGPRTDGLAIAALVLGIFSLVCSWVCLGVILGPAAAIMGFISRNRIAASGGTIGGGGLAMAGLVLGIIGFLASAGFVLIYVISAASSNSSS